MRTVRHYPSECGICLDNFEEATFHSSNAHSPAEIQCGHIFGKSCLITWARTTTQSNHNKCPLCSERLFKKSRSESSSRAQADTSNRPNSSSRSWLHSVRSMRSLLSGSREDADSNRELSSNDGHRAQPRYPPAPTAVTATPSEDSWYAQSRSGASAENQTQDPAGRSNTPASSSRNSSRRTARTSALSEDASRTELPDTLRRRNGWS